MMRRAILTVLGLAIMAQPAWAEIGRIKRSVGATAVERGKAKLTPAPGFQLLPGDTLVTGKNGQMSLTFIDDTRFSVGPNSRISVDDFTYDRTAQSGSFVTRVNRGSLAVVSGQIAKSKPDAMKVRTPTSLLGVRGTRFIVEVSK
ncbi:FecR domain-containing protein [Rhizorhabdus histidinilytica]|uniref:FecR family protein n=1 Tax=Rhizorhabdus histidinilytica TaxID=439228 RepID=A0A1T5BYE4_9SPHN|nr:FecR family protein [Rhizorhabdus histidinilytica]SKB52181.1 FecR family protein [Rhizorhabdus histidinilytica]